MRIGKFSFRQRWIDREVSPSLTFAVASFIGILGFIFGLLAAWYGPWLWEEFLLHKGREAFHWLSSLLLWTWTGKDVLVGGVVRFVPIGVVGSVFSYFGVSAAAGGVSFYSSGLLLEEYKTSGGVGVSGIVNGISPTANFSSLGA